MEQPAGSSRDVEHILNGGIQVWTSPSPRRPSPPRTRIILHLKASSQTRIAVRVGLNAFTGVIFIPSLFLMWLISNPMGALVNVGLMDAPLGTITHRRQFHLCGSFLSLIGVWMFLLLLCLCTSLVKAKLRATRGQLLCSNVLLGGSDDRRV